MKIILSLLAGVILSTSVQAQELADFPNESGATSIDVTGSIGHIECKESLTDASGTLTETSVLTSSMDAEELFVTHQINMIRLGTYMITGVRRDTISKSLNIIGMTRGSGPSKVLIINLPDVEFEFHPASFEVSSDTLDGSAPSTESKNIQCQIAYKGG